MDTSPLSRLPRLLPALAGLGLLGLAGASPAAAQKLTLGDFTNPGSATISGTGTTAAGTYSFAGGAGPGTISYNEVDLNDPPSAATDLTLQTGGSITTLVGNGGTATVTGGSLGEADLNQSTVLNVQGGSVQSTYALNGSQINVSGGTVGTLSAASSSSATITGGNVTSAGTGNDGQLTISGGTTQEADNNEGSLSVTGGAVTKVVNVANDFGTSVSISGGTVGTLQNDAYCQTYVSGGKFQFIVNNATPIDGGFIDISGTDLKAVQYNGPGPYDALLTGTLSDGDALHALYAGSVEGGPLEFNGNSAPLSPVPEAASSVSLGLLLCLGLGGLTVARRRKNAA